MERYDAIVLGLGGMGSAALAHLAQRGIRVLGLEQFHPAHALGSSHGGSRLIRKAYHEDPAYVPLLLRAYELWSDLERRTGSALLLKTGGLMAGYEGCEVVEGAARSAREHHLTHQLLTAADIRRRFPMLRPADDECAVYEPDAGVLFPETCVLAHLHAAVAEGAEARFGTRVESWALDGDGVVVTTASGRISADRLVICAGPWSGEIMSAFGLPLQVERNVMHWFDPREHAERFEASTFPIYILQRRGVTPLYGCPLLPGQGVKVAFHYSEQFTTPAEIERQVAPSEVDTIRRALQSWIPDAAGTWRRSTVCMYTNTPDKHFVVGLHPQDPRIVFAGGFSGHGFKFCPVIGEILADLALQGRATHPISLFSPTRFSVRLPNPPPAAS